MKKNAQRIDPLKAQKIRNIDKIDVNSPFFVVTFSAGGAALSWSRPLPVGRQQSIFRSHEPFDFSILSSGAGGAAPSKCRFHETVDQFDLYEHRRTGDDVDYSIARNIRPEP